VYMQFRTELFGECLQGRREACNTYNPHKASKELAVDGDCCWVSYPGYNRDSFGQEKEVELVFYFIGMDFSVCFLFQIYSSSLNLVISRALENYCSSL